MLPQTSSPLLPGGRTWTEGAKMVERCANRGEVFIFLQFKKWKEVRAESESIVSDPK